MKYILSIGINDYRITLGGVNKVILAHQEMFRKNGYEYIYIYPAWKKKNQYEYWKIIINNHYIRVKNTANLLHYLYHLQSSGHKCAEIHVHHLMKVSLRHLDKLLSQIQSPIKFYIHDYFTICPSIKMLRDDTEFCGCEQMSPTKCRQCKYYADGKESNMKVRKFIQKYAQRTTFIVPSHSAKAHWLKAYPQYKDKIQIIYHQIYKGHYDGNHHKIEDGKAIKVAYIGEPLPSKGWDIWKKIIAANPDGRYQFYYLGSSDIKLKDVENVNVDFRKKIDAMTTALREHDIDCILLWSICAETYSYTYYEGVSANAFIITNKNSGNIAYQTAAHKNGLVLDTPEEVVRLFRNYGHLRCLINDYKAEKVNGPDKLVENPEILKYVGQPPERPISGQPKLKISISETILQIIFRMVEQIRRFKKEVP